MALLETMLIIVILIILVIVIYNVFFAKQTMLMSGIHSTATGVIIQHSKLPKNNTSNFSFSIWFFIEDWNHEFGSIKNVVYFAGSKLPKIDNASNSATSNSSPYLYPFDNNFIVALDAYENNLLIGINTFARSDNANLQNPTHDYSQQNTQRSHERYETFRINNINVQKWVCLTCSVEGRNLDIYLHGKLVRSFILPGIATNFAQDNVYIGKNGNIPTYNGHVACFQFWNHSLNPQQAYNVYRDGLSQCVNEHFFNKYRMTVQFYEYDNAIGKPLII